jgi:hypothetical protein
VLAIGATRRACLTACVRNHVDTRGPISHESHPRLFQYAANTCADST